MQKHTVNGGADIFSWCPSIEGGALEDAMKVARQPYVKHYALMPDCHGGAAAPIGSVIGCDNTIVPWAVGVDIGCGMCAMKTSLHKDELAEEEFRKAILDSFSRAIPVGFSHNTDKRRTELEKEYKEKLIDILIETSASPDNLNPIGSGKDVRKAFFGQLGTLGGGNHFIEIQYDENGSVWIMIHSGSRNIGKKVCDYYNDQAKVLNSRWFSRCDSDVPFLPVDSQEGREYLAWMNFALQFAYMNRKVMMESVKAELGRFFKDIEYITDEVVNDSDEKIINIHHNFAALENHMGKNMWVHRKGATKAFDGQTGIIPGSMGTCSYIVRGLGHNLSLSSCSHGAGRRMGRVEFCVRMKDSYAQIENSLSGVVHSDFGTYGRGRAKGLKDVSEAPAAYKDIDDVIENELDLITPIVKLKPMLCLKG